MQKHLKVITVVLVLVGINYVLGCGGEERAAIKMIVEPR